jgi:hypothetical protein
VRRHLVKIGVLVTLATSSACDGGDDKEIRGTGPSGAGGEQSGPGSSASSSSSGAGATGGGGAATSSSASSSSSSSSTGSGCGGEPGSGGGSGGQAPVGALEVLATGQAEPSGIATFADHVYWTNRAGGSVARLPKGGGAVETLSTGQDEPSAIAVDASGVYWVTNFSLMTAPLDGGPATEVGSVFVGSSVAVDASHAYVAAFDEIVKLPKTGGAPQVLATASYVSTLTIDDAGVFFTVDTFTGSSLRRVGKSGGAVLPLISEGCEDELSLYSPMGIAKDVDRVYWATHTGNHVWSVAATGGTPLGFGFDGEYPSALAIDDGHVYWTTDPPSGTGHVRRATKTGDYWVDLAEAQAPRAIAVDDTGVYWAGAGDGTISRIVK